MKLEIPTHCKSHIVTVGERTIKLTNLEKVFWPGPGFTKRDLLLYYAEISETLIPHLNNRAMVMKRYPNGIEGEFFFMKRTPSYKPDWLETCSIEHASGNIIAFPMAQDLASLLWIVNLGWSQVLETALVVRDELAKLKMKTYPKTTGSRGIHVYIPIERGPLQKEVWTFAKAFAQALAARHPTLITAEYRVAKRPAGRVLVDYNQNAWGRTLASVYSVRPKPSAAVSTPVSWDEIERGIRIEDFTMGNVPERIRTNGDLFKPLLAKKGRVKLERQLAAVPAA